MANSKYEYVKNFEQDDRLLPNTWIVIRIDGRGFHKFSDKNEFEKPNDKRALDLMNAAAMWTMEDLTDIVMGYGVSDEYSFVLHKSCSLFERRSSKLITTIASTFTAYYVSCWETYFGKKLVGRMPSFDGRAVLYPTVQNMRDYMSWRQADCHINNLYNTTFWTLVKGGTSTTEAEMQLKGTLAADKNEILFKRFGINYNDEPQIFRKGSVIFRDYEPPTIADGPFNAEEEANLGTVQLSKTEKEKERKNLSKALLVVEHVDIIQDEFWKRRPWLLSNRPGKPKKME